MDCLEFERQLEALSEGRLPAAREAACRRHARSCVACGDLLSLLFLRVPGAKDAVPDLVPSVLERTVGSACRQAREQLCEHVDGEQRRAERELVELHLSGCRECRALAAVLVRLAEELPSLAEREADPRFVRDVLAATLPVPVQLRRWWRRAWPTMVRRPRFALEGAYVGLLVLILVFASAGASVEAMPQRAIELTRNQLTRSQPALWNGVVAELGERVESTVAAVRASDAVSKLGEKRAATEAKAGAVQELWGRAQAKLGTLWEEAASLLEKDGEEPSLEPNDSTEE